MAKIKNNFLKATVNKDLDERLTPNGQMTDAENAMVISEDNGNAGVLKNVKGNLKVTSLNIADSETIGSIADDAKDRCFYFVTSPTYDYVIQFNILNNTTEIVLQSTHGTGVLNFSSSYRISHSDLFVSVEGDDLLAWTDGLNPPRIIEIEKAKAYGVNGFTQTEISVMKPSPIFAPTTNLVSTNTDTLSNFLEDKFLQFAYRYKYDGGYYSSISSWSQVAFVPSSFDLDYQTYENLGMVNLANAVDISFNCGDESVIGVDLLFKESESSTVYVIDKFLKSEEGWTIPNQQITYSFSGNKIYGVLEESQYFRSFDNVPLTAKTQARIGNRLIYGNFVEGRDINDKVSLSVDYVSSPLVLDEKVGVVEDFIDGDTLFSNLVDFERGNLDGGISPVSDQMNYSSNTLNAVISTLPGLNTIYLVIEITPKAEYLSSVYNLVIKKSGVVLFNETNLSGVETITKTISTDSNLTFFITSEDGLIYDLKLNYNIEEGSIGILSRWDYYAEDQLSYPKSGGYAASLEGDTIINRYSEFDFNLFDFQQGKQMRFEFDLQSSLIYDVKPSLTFFYNLEDNYTDLQDFLLNSEFVETIEGVFSDSFVSGTNAFASNAGTLVSYVGFKISSTGDTLRITTPEIVYSVTEDSGITENKNDFYLNKNVSFGLYSEDAFTSMHSNRDYTCDIIYLDNEGRKTTVISGGDTSVYIPALESENVNKLRVETLSTPPSWAKYYKFVIKETKRGYQTIYGNVVYEDSIYRWIKLTGENKNKVKEGDILLLKSDYSGVVDSPIQIKVIEVATKASDFIPNNVTSGGDDLIEESGLYFKIKQGAFNINIGDNTFVTYEGFGKRRYASRSFVSTEPLFGEYNGSGVFVPTPVTSGTQIKFEVKIWAKGAIAFEHIVTVNTFAQDDYPSVKDWWDAEVSTLGAWTSFAADYLKDYEWTIDDGFGTRFRVKPWRDGTASRDIMTKVTFDVNFSGGTLVFENYDPEQLDAPYYESVETYNVVNGAHFSGNSLTPNIHVLNKTFNCFTFGNGVESNAVKDSFAGKKFYINSNPTSISEDTYRQVNRYADLTYSGIYQEGTNVNRLNEFNLSLANYKDDLDKGSGEIIRLDSDQTDLLVIQEDKWSKVLYGKDLLYNTDATTNLSRIEDVLGQQVMYSGEYGISYHPDSYDDYGTNSFCTDTKRGVVLRYNESNGLSEISNSGLRDYFKTLFRDNEIVNIIGQYDAFFDVYFLNIKYKIKGKNYNPLPVKYDYVTWVYSPEVEGFLGRQTFDPDSMLRVRNQFLSFKGADVYRHNIGSYNTFYNTLHPVSFAFNFNEDPSSRKIFKNISIEGNSSWNVALTTDMQNGYINQGDFVNKEGVQYAYVRGNDALDLSTIAVTGLGAISAITGVSVFLSEIPSTISVGDLIYNSSLTQIGTIVFIESNYIVLSSVAGLSVGSFILSSKPSSIETSGIRGYYMNSRFSAQPTSYVEVFSINSEAVKSFE